MGKEFLSNYIATHEGYEVLFLLKELMNYLSHFDDLSKAFIDFMKSDVPEDLKAILVSNAKEKSLWAKNLNV